MELAAWLRRSVLCFSWLFSLDCLRIRKKRALWLSYSFTCVLILAMLRACVCLWACLGFIIYNRFCHGGLFLVLCLSLLWLLYQSYWLFELLRWFLHFYIRRKAGRFFFLSLTALGNVYSILTYVWMFVWNCGRETRNFVVYGSYVGRSSVFKDASGGVFPLQGF